MWMLQIGLSVNKILECKCIHFFALNPLANYVVKCRLDFSDSDLALASQSNKFGAIGNRCVNGDFYYFPPNSEPRIGGNPQVGRAGGRVVLIGNKNSGCKLLVILYFFKKNAISFFLLLQI